MSIASISANAPKLTEYAAGTAASRAARQSAQGGPVERADDGAGDPSGAPALGLALPSSSLNRVGVAAYLALMHPAPLSSMRAEA